jgi:hypothetical protein
MAVFFFTQAGNVLLASWLGERQGLMHDIADRLRAPGKSHGPVRSGAINAQI